MEEADMKRFLAFTAMLCSICVLFSSCFFLPGLENILDHWEQTMQNSPDRSSNQSENPAFSQDDSIDAARTVSDLQKKYGFTIKDPDGLLSDENGPENCAVIDKTLEIFSKPMIKGFLKILWRRDCSFSMEFLDEASNSLGETSYDYNNIRIKIFAPRDTRDPSIFNGITVETIAHEIGHAVHDALEYQYGTDEIKRVWTKLNGSYTYGDEWDSGCDAFFAYEYGLTDYYEDIATVFEDLAAFPQATASRLSQPESEPLYLKVKYLYTMMEKTFDMSESSLFDAYETAASRRKDTASFEESLSAFTPSSFGRHMSNSYIGTYESIEAA
jgi:hypothetical protein